MPVDHIPILRDVDSDGGTMPRENILCTKQVALMLLEAPAQNWLPPMPSIPLSRQNSNNTFTLSTNVWPWDASCVSAFSMHPVKLGRYEGERWKWEFKS